VDGSQGLVTFVKRDRWFDNMNYRALGPRLGLAWRPLGKENLVVRAGYGIAFDTISSFQVTAVSGRVPGLVAACTSTLGPNAATTPGCTAAPDRRISQGFPDELPPPSVKPSAFLKPEAQLLSNAPALAVFDSKLQVPTVHQWNVNIQKRVGEGLIAQIGYVARRGTRLYRAYDINQTDIGSALDSFLALQRNFNAGCMPDGTRCPAGVTPAVAPLLQRGVVNAAFVNSATTQNDLRLNAAGTFAGRVEQTTLAARLRPNQQFGTVTYIDSGGDSYYHSFQATLRKRFSKGLLAGVAYTLGKSIDNQSVDPVAASSGGGLSTTNSRTPTDIRNFRLERARSDFDRTHTMTANFVYDLPFAKQRVFGGWSVNGLYTFMTGEPFSVRSGVRTANFSHESRADVVGAKPETRLQEVAGVVGPVIFANNNGFAIPAPGSNGAGRNIFSSPLFWNFDFSVSKRFTITERIGLQFRAEMFNMFNHPNFDNPRDASVGSPSFNSALFGQTCCATVSTASSRSIIQTGESARVIQLALRLQF
jgi:hypothetical protein